MLSEALREKLDDRVVEFGRILTADSDLSTLDLPRSEGYGASHVFVR